MDFFAAQDAARARSRTLVALFLGAVLAIIAAIYMIVHVVLGPGIGQPIDPALLLFIAFGVTLLVVAGSATRTAQLRGGGAVVAEMLGGRRVRPDTTDPLERRLVNVVEELSIASGTPVPAIFVLDGELGINAFAAGYTLDDAAVAVTRGALEALGRDELQGVIAHEFSHILNGDMRLNIRLIGLLFGILLLAIVGRGLLRGGTLRGGRRSRNGGGAQVAAIGLGLVAVGYIGVFFGRLIQAAVSRQREYLADAAAVQFTRDPAGIAGALRRIGQATGGSRVVDHHAAEASHLFFANGLSRPFMALLATHPPLADRIRRLDPGGAAVADGPATTGAATHASFATPASGAAGFAGAAGTAPAAAAQPPVNLLAAVGAPGPEHVAYAQRLLESLPDEVLASAHDAEGASLLLFALLRSDDGEVAGAQEKLVRSFAGETAAERWLMLARLIQPFGTAARLPLLDILLPALRLLPADRRAVVRATAEQLVRADGRVAMFELAVLHILKRQLAEASNAAAAGAESVSSLAPLRGEAELVLSAVAWSGADSPEAARAAFAEGIAQLPQRAGALALRERREITIAGIDGALQKLRGASGGVRRSVLDACTRTIAHDGQVRLQEAELLRAVSEALDSPMPPALATSSAALSSR